MRTRGKSLLPRTWLPGDDPPPQRYCEGRPDPGHRPPPPWKPGPAICTLVLPGHVRALIRQLADERGKGMPETTLELVLAALSQEFGAKINL